MKIKQWESRLAASAMPLSFCHYYWEIHTQAGLQCVSFTRRIGKRPAAKPALSARHILPILGIPTKLLAFPALLAVSPAALTVFPAGLLRATARPGSDGIGAVNEFITMLQQ